MTTQRENGVTSERRNEVRLDGKQVDGIQICLVDSQLTEGWDQSQRWEGAIHNLSAGGIEVKMSKNSLAVDQLMYVHLNFPKSSDELKIPAVIRHIHQIPEGILVGLQFAWNHPGIRDFDLEYRFCNQLLICERRGI